MKPTSRAVAWILTSTVTAGILSCLLIAGCAPTPQEEVDDDDGPPNIVLPDIPAPPDDVPRLSIRSPYTVHSGEAIDIHITSNGEPVPGVTLGLLGDTVLTDEMGRATLTAPEVTRPHTYYISVSKEGFVHYLEDPPGVLFQTIGWYPLGIEFIAFPKLWTPIANVAASIQFDIDQPLGFFGGVTSFDDIEQKALEAGYDADENWWAESKEISRHLEEGDGEDVWIFFGHANDTDGDGVVDGLTGLEDRGTSAFTGGELRRYSKRRIDRHLTSDGDPPGFIFLGGCKTADLLDNLIESSVKVAVGFDDTLPLSIASAALKAFWEDLLDGEALADATAAADSVLNKAAEGLGLFNPQGANLVVKTKPWLDGDDMTLSELLEAEDPEEEGGDTEEQD